MILQALARYYDILAGDPKTSIAPPGYSKVGVSFALNISAKGELLDIFPLFTPEQRGKKTVDVPLSMLVPEQVKRTGINPLPNFLWDNNVFVLGISEKDENDTTYAATRFEAFRRFNRELLIQADCEAAGAVIEFLNQHNPSQARQNPVIARFLETLLKGGNLVFKFRDGYVHEDPVIRQIWEMYKAGQKEVLGQCLVTGEIAPIARLHPSLKRIRGAQPTGATLVGFNDRAYESFNRTKGQGLNSPVSQKSVFAYTTALNYLLSADNPNPPIFLGDTTVVYWAESEKKEYPSAFASLFGPAVVEIESDLEHEARREAEAHLGRIASNLQRAQPLDAADLFGDLDQSVRFYVLGLAPNAARVSVRFFITEPFGKIIDRILQHYRDLQVIREYENQPKYIPLRTLIGETVSRKAKDQDAAPLLAGAVLRAILTGSPYPAALYYAIINRVRADMDDQELRISKINYVRAAIVKAFLIRKYRHQPQHPYQEVLIMSLNENSTVPAYVLGRLFAVLEKVQKEAIGEMNASIRDRYFTSACASPASVFPVLLRLSQHHIAKAEYGNNADRRIQDLLEHLNVETNPFPARLSLDEQGLFILGYYHQRAAFYIKTGENNAQPTPSNNQ
jgi:CRISPR-associated protein Csd1